MRPNHTNKHLHLAVTLFALAFAWASCDEASESGPGGACVPIGSVDGQDCEDGDPCNGVETCGADGTCEGGDPVVCGANAHCAPDGACTCDGGFLAGEDGVCVAPACTTDADCDNDLPCDGLETCAQDGVCVAGDPIVCEGTGRSCEAESGDCLCGSGYEEAGGGAEDVQDCVPESSAQLIDFEEVVLDEEGFWKGADGSGALQIGAARFSNHYDTEYESWDGFAVSNWTDSETTGFGNQYSAFPGAGAGGSETYAISYIGFTAAPRIDFPEAAEGVFVDGVHITNSTYAALSMLQGDEYSKKFGGDTGLDPDWFRLTITGYDAADEATGAVEVYLADYRFDEASEDHVLDLWQSVSLSELGRVHALDFALDSSDVGDWGMNTPAFFALDDLSFAPLALRSSTLESVPLEDESFWNGDDASGGIEDGGVYYGNSYNAEYMSWEGFAVANTTDTETASWENQYSALPGHGADDSAQWAVGYGYAGSATNEKPWLSFTGAPEGVWPQSVSITNTAYAFLTMASGDDYSKKFGGADGSDPDWFRLDIQGLTAAGELTDPIEVYLADFRSDDPAEDHILADWRVVDLRPLGRVVGLFFDLASSDNGDWGMNTPAYFALDELDVLSTTP